ncbi:MAG: TIGR02147 family protein [Chitinispirillaceae bacterium]
MINVFEYTDFRKYLSDFYWLKKQRQPTFSYRIIANKVGFKSTGHFTKIIQGKANISLALGLRFADFLSLTKRQSEYFQLMVLYNQAKNHEDKKKFFERMMMFKEARVRTVDLDHYEFYDKWYYTVIREIIGLYPYKNNYKRLASLVEPPISADEARKAIELLEKLDMIRKDENGRYIQTEPLIKNDYTVPSVAVNNFILSMLDKAREALDRYPRDQRMLSSTTITISDATFRKIQEEIREFRNRIMTLAARDKDSCRSYNFNFQVFPVTKIIPTDIRNED